MLKFKKKIRRQKVKIHVTVRSGLFLSLILILAMRASCPPILFLTTTLSEHKVTVVVDDCIMKSFIVCTRQGLWAGHMARQGKQINSCRILMTEPEGKRLLGRQGVDGRIILK